MALTLKIENFTNNIPNVHVYQPDGTRNVVALPTEEIACQSGCKFVFFHAPEQHWFQHDDSDVYKHVSTGEACQLSIPSDCTDGESTLYLFSFGNLGDVFDYKASDGWVTNIMPHSFSERDHV